MLFKPEVDDLSEAVGLLKKDLTKTWCNDSPSKN
jgi:hypothetical protein